MGFKYLKTVKTEKSSKADAKCYILVQINPPLKKLGSLSSVVALEFTPEVELRPTSLMHNKNWSQNWTRRRNLVEITALSANLDGGVHCLCDSYIGSRIAANLAGKLTLNATKGCFHVVELHFLGKSGSLSSC
jgi:hypothetical protein